MFRVSDFEGLGFLVCSVLMMCEDFWFKVSRV